MSPAAIDRLERFEPLERLERGHRCSCGGRVVIPPRGRHGRHGHGYKKQHDLCNRCWRAVLASSHSLRGRPMTEDRGPIQEAL